MQRVIDLFEVLRRHGQKLGPYLMLEILLPGGSLFALALFLYQRRKAATGRGTPWPVAAFMRLWVSLVPQGILMPQPCYARPSRALRSPIDSRE
ncbi:MAG TPA: hypothetical protein VFJ68_10305 [Casimicrobiaceae bacterium]|nr:hypothetical protein [Casimicrobiaceae bacterium]